MDKTVILGVKLNHRMTTATAFQKVVSDWGCNIKTRIGIHNAENGKCSPTGVILLDVIGTDQEIMDIENSLKNIPDIEIQKMVFNQT